MQPKGRQQNCSPALGQGGCREGRSLALLRSARKRALHPVFGARGITPARSDPNQGSDRGRSQASLGRGPSARHQPPKRRPTGRTTPSPPAAASRAPWGAGPRRCPGARGPPGHTRQPQRRDRGAPPAQTSAVPGRGSPPRCQAALGAAGPAGSPLFYTGKPYLRAARVAGRPSQPPLAWDARSRGAPGRWPALDSFCDSAGRRCRFIYGRQPRFRRRGRFPGGGARRWRKRPAATGTARTWRHATCEEVGLETRVGARGRGQRAVSGRWAVGQSSAPGRGRRAGLPAP